MGARASPDRGCLELACWDQNRGSRCEAAASNGPAAVAAAAAAEATNVFLKQTRCALKRPAPHGDRAQTQLCRLDPTGLKRSYAV